MKNVTRDATSIRAAIRECEGLSDELQGALARLKLAMLNARANPDILPHAGQLAFIRLSAVEKDMQNASNNLARTHDELSRLAPAMGPDHLPTHESALAGRNHVFEAHVDAIQSSVEPVSN